MKLPRFVNSFCSKSCPSQISADEVTKDDELEEQEGIEDKNDAKSQKKIGFQICSVTNEKLRGHLTIVGAVLIQLAVGAHHGTFGNMLPYFTSFMRQTDATLIDADLTVVLSAGGIMQGIANLLAGLVIVPLCGLKGCLLLGCFIFCLATLLTYQALYQDVVMLIITYGVLYGVAVQLVLVPLSVLPAAWFPERRGLVIGIVMGAYGLSALLITPYQTWLINPGNINPEQVLIQFMDCNSSKTFKYFTDAGLLERIPQAMLYLAAVYTVLIVIGLLMITEKPKTNDDKQPSLSSKFIKNFKFLYTKILNTRDFWFLFLSRLTYMIIIAALLIFWKSVSLKLSGDDQLVSSLGGLLSVMNCLSRFLGGYLNDRFSFRFFQSMISFTIMVVFIITMFLYSVNLYGFVICVSLLYLLSFTHFSSIPAQAIYIFNSEYNGALIGTLGLTDTLAYLSIGIINRIIFSAVDIENPFFAFFLIMAALSAISVFFNVLVSNRRREFTN